MRFKSLLEDMLLSRVVGLAALWLLWLVMLCVAPVVWLSSDRSGAVVRQVPLREHPLYTVLVFNTRCRVGNFLRRYSLHSLPALVPLLQGQLSALDLVEVDWRAIQ